MKTMRLEKEGGERQAGFTLLEVIIAISILTAGLLAVATMQVSAIYGNAVAGKVTEGTSVAQAKLEELLSLQYTLTATDDNLSEGTHNGGTSSGYTTTWTVENNTPFDNTKKIAVTVTWQNKGVTSSTSLVSCLARS